MLLWDNVRDTYQIQYIFVNIINCYSGTIKHIDGLERLIFIAQTTTGQQISLNINCAF